MKDRWKKCLLAALFWCMWSLIAGCAGPERSPAGTPSETIEEDVKKEPLTIWVASDLHYLSQELYDDSPIFIKTLEQGDGKLTERMPEILEVFTEQVLAARPDALVLAGDLTFNGELQSLRELAGQLDVIRQAGIPVLVLPGNHDGIQYMPVSYLNGQMSGTESISRSSFWEVCGPFGYDQAVSRDDTTFSYVYELTEDVQLVLLDANMMEPGTEYGKGTIPDPTMKWLEGQLAAAQQARKTVLTVTHQNVLHQNSLLYYGFALYNDQEVSALLQKYGVTVNVSGHSHIQHMSQENELKDYAVGPLSVTPLRYGVITVDEQREIHYEMASLTEPRPADAQDIPVSEKAMGLAAEAVARYEVCESRQVMEALEEIQQRAGFTDAEQEAMTAFVVEVNRAYMSGDLTGQQEYLASGGWALWTKYCQNDFWWQYLHNILTEQ